jgi:glycerol-3-phosphate dehydrogenase
VSVADALLRRTRLGLLAARAVADPAGETAQRVAAAMGTELGWDAARARNEARAFLDEAAAEGIVTDP